MISPSFCDAVEHYSHQIFEPTYNPSPETILWEMVLLDAIVQAANGSSKDRAWLLNPNAPSNTPFNDVCSYLNINPDYMRLKIRRALKHNFHYFGRSPSKLVKNL